MSEQDPNHQIPDPGLSDDPTAQSPESEQPEIIPQEPRGQEVRRIRIYAGARKPVVTYALLALTIAVYAFQLLSKQLTGVDLGVAFGAKFGPLIYAGQVWRLFTPIFLHGSIMHIAFNMYALMILGKDLEPSWGKLNFLIFYLIAGFGGNVFSAVISPNTVSVGASTSLFGLIIAQAFLIYRNRKFFRNYRNAITNTLFIVAINLTIGMSSGIDNWGHLGGLVSGALIALMSTPVMDVVYNPALSRYELRDTFPQPKRNLAFLLVFLFFAALAFAFRRAG